VTDCSAHRQNLREAWNETWTKVRKKESKLAVWDVDPSRCVEADWPLFRPVFPHNLKLIDVGCGTGYQTAFLSSKFSCVVGVDASVVAIELAREREPELTFLERDLFEANHVEELARGFAPANLYVRGVLHQIPGPLRPKFLSALELLMGHRGCAFFHDSAIDHRTKFSSLPPNLKRILFSKCPPTPFSVEELASVFSRTSYSITVGTATMPVRTSSTDNDIFEIPSSYFLVAPLKELRGNEISLDL
jgi:SAM-dependent methyltransferase